MEDFYQLIDTYAALNNIDSSEALHLWYRGSINAGDLLQAYLEYEGIFGYSASLMRVFRALTEQARKDHNSKDIWID